MKTIQWAPTGNPFEDIPGEIQEYLRLPHYSIWVWVWSKDLNGIQT